MIIVEAYNIVYDTDGEEVEDLPTELTVKVEDDDLHYEFINEKGEWEVGEVDEETLRDAVVDLISDHTGWLVESFDFKVVDDYIIFEDGSK